jgi:hypothetical protein
MPSFLRCAHHGAPLGTHRSRSLTHEYLIPLTCYCRCNALTEGSRPTKRSEGPRCLSSSTPPRYSVSVLPSPKFRPTHRSLSLRTGNIMTEYTYPECTTSVITGLSVFREYYPEYRQRDVEYVPTLNDLFFVSLF